MYEYSSNIFIFIYKSVILPNKSTGRKITNRVIVEGEEGINTFYGRREPKEHKGHRTKPIRPYFL